jgi:ABC-type glutathione transport system ATPase component
LLFANKKRNQFVLNLLSKIKTEMGIIFITHRLHVLKSFCDKIYIIENGTTLKNGTHEALLQSENIYSHYWNDLITQYKNDIRSISTYKEVGRLIDLWYEDKEAISYKRDIEKLCDELVSVCDALKGDEIWISSQAWSKLNEKI